MESSTSITQCERDTLATILNAVKIIFRSLLVGVIGQLTGREHRQVQVIGYDCGSHGQCCEHCIECIACFKVSTLHCLFLQGTTSYLP